MKQNRQIQKIIKSAVADKIFPGCIIGMVRKNGQRVIKSFGNYTYEKTSPAIKEDSIFDIASITKTIPTATLALQLVDRGQLSLDDQLIKFIPEFNNSDRDRVLIRHLLTYTLDFDFKLSDYKEKSPDEILELIFTTEFKSPPGTKFYYANASAILLGLVIERIIGEKLDQIASRQLFNPLKMTRTTFHPQEFPKNKIVPTEIDQWRGLVQGVVHDESAYTLQKKMIIGSAGLFSTASDLLNFLEMMLNHGKLADQRFLSENLVDSLLKNHLPSDVNGSTSLGWAIGRSEIVGDKLSPDALYKTGFTGCLIVCDIEKEIGIVILSNYHFPKRKDNFEPLNKFRRPVINFYLANL